MKRSRSRRLTRSPKPSQSSAAVYSTAKPFRPARTFRRCRIGIYRIDLLRIEVFSTDYRQTARSLPALGLYTAEAKGTSLNS